MIEKRKGCAEITILSMILVVAFVFLIFLIGVTKRNFEHQTIKMIADNIKVNEKLFTVEMNENELIIRRKNK